MARIWLGRYKHEIFCCSGSENSCHNLRLLRSLDDQIQDERLRKATDDINAILAAIRDSPPRDGVRLGLIDSGRGLLLTWIKPRARRPRNISTYTSIKSPRNQIADFLGLDLDKSGAS
jgi:hypothetical protein